MHTTIRSGLGCVSISFRHGEPHGVLTVFFLFAILYRLGPDQAYILEKKLECLYPEDKTVYTAKQDLRRANKRNSQLKILRSKLFQCIWEQSEYGEHDIG